MSETVVIVGTGGVAPGIAASFAAAGCDVVVAGRDDDRAAACAAAAGARIGSGALVPATFAGATLVVETVVEDLAVKQDLLERIEPWPEDEALIVSNTSASPWTRSALGCATGRGSRGCTSCTRRT